MRKKDKRPCSILLSKIDDIMKNSPSSKECFDTMERTHSYYLKDVFEWNEAYEKSKAKTEQSDLLCHSEPMTYTPSVHQA